MYSTTRGVPSPCGSIARHIHSQDSVSHRLDGPVESGYLVMQIDAQYTFSLTMTTAQITLVEQSVIAWRIFSAMQVYPKDTPSVAPLRMQFSHGLGREVVST